MKKELFVIFILAIAPVFISYFVGGTELLSEIIKGMVAHQWILYYTMGGAILFFPVSYLKYRFIFNNENLESFHQFLSISLYEMALSLQGILRISGGVLFGVAILWFIFDYRQDHVQRILYIGGIGVVAILECFIVDKWLIYAKTNWLKIHT